MSEKTTKEARTAATTAWKIWSKTQNLTRLASKTVLLVKESHLIRSDAAMIELMVRITKRSKTRRRPGKSFRISTSISCSTHQVVAHISSVMRGHSMRPNVDPRTACREMKLIWATEASTCLHNLPNSTDATTTTTTTVNAKSKTGLLTEMISFTTLAAVNPPNWSTWVRLQPLVFPRWIAPVLLTRSKTDKMARVGRGEAIQETLQTVGTLPWRNWEWMIKMTKTMTMVPLWTTRLEMTTITKKTCATNAAHQSNQSMMLHCLPVSAASALRSTTKASLRAH